MAAGCVLLLVLRGHLGGWFRLVGEVFFLVGEVFSLVGFKWGHLGPWGEGSFFPYVDFGGRQP